MKFVYCSQCGMKLPVRRKALPNYGVVIDVIDPHVCASEPLEFDLKPIDPITSGALKEPEGKFVQKLNELGPISSSTLRDRRINVRSEGEEIRSTAPKSIFDLIEKMAPSRPEKEVNDIGLDDEEDK